MTDPPRQICPHCGKSFRADPHDPGRLVSAIAAHVGDRWFTAPELIGHADLVAGPLRDAIGDRSRQQLGKALHRIANAGQTWDGIGIEAGSKEANVRLWRVRANPNQPR